MLKTVISRVRSEGLQTSYGLGTVCAAHLSLILSVRAESAMTRKKTLFTTFCHSDRFIVICSTGHFHVCLFIFRHFSCYVTGVDTFPRLLFIYMSFLLILTSCGSWVRGGICSNSVLKSFLSGILITPRHELNCFFPLFLPSTFSICHSHCLSLFLSHCLSVTDSDSLILPYLTFALLWPVLCCLISPVPA
jgi:hypothetical protein